ncbi:MHYT domain-containing protein [Streptomyces sp. NBC_00838]|uniref:MHYT domain-containing protein n=1 Tax=Streptomyces sp. NBC_00838 TaxID=2903680 RepID=UPI003868E114|nr:MHYT domain-containing protein [Streptomyces sp. NBC_00838]
MQGTVDGFSYGVITPIAAFVMACFGSALGLRCVTRSLRAEQSFKPGWLSLGAASIGCGIWTMHFIAMMGFQIRQTPIDYDVPLTVASLVVAVLVVSVGVFVVGYRGSSPPILITAGVLTGLGVAAMHYLGMAGMRLEGRLHYDTTIVAVSVVIAVVAATAALWAAVSVRGFFPSLVASLIMGAAATGMHCTGIAAMSVHLAGGAPRPGVSGDSLPSVMLPMLLGPLVFLVLAGVVVMFDPLLVLGDGEWNDSPTRKREPGRPGRTDTPDLPGLPGTTPGDANPVPGPPAWTATANRDTGARSPGEESTRQRRW